MAHWFLGPTLCSVLAEALYRVLQSPNPRSALTLLDSQELARWRAVIMDLYVSVLGRHYTIPLHSSSALCLWFLVAGNPTVPMKPRE